MFEIPVTDTPGYEQILRIANNAIARTGGEAASAAADFQASAGSPAAPKVLLDRAAFDHLLARHLGAAVSQDSPLSIILIEIDHLKMIGTERGRAAGERVLSTVGRLLGAISRPQDYPARLGNDRLVLLLPGAARAQAAASAEAVRKALATRPITVGNGLSIPITLSAGVASFEAGIPLRDPAHLMKAADMALLAARQSGRNCVRVFTLAKSGSHAIAA